MLLEIEVKKRLQGEWYDYPTAEFTGMTARQILVFIDRQDMIMKINQGIGKSVFVVGKEETLVKYRGHRTHSFITVKEALARWQNSPLLDIVWPPFEVQGLAPDIEDDAGVKEALSSLQARCDTGKRRGKVQYVLNFTSP